jgi:hypothetical protein
VHDNRPVTRDDVAMAAKLLTMGPLRAQFLPATKAAPAATPGSP